MDDKIHAFCDAARGLFDQLLADGKSPEEAAAMTRDSVLRAADYLVVEHKWLAERGPF